MTTSDLVAWLTTRANLTYSYPIEDILLLRSAADEIVRLREALEKIKKATYESDPYYGGADLVVREIARAALAEKEEK